jgi:hypothetical protein
MRCFMLALISSRSTVADLPEEEDGTWRLEMESHLMFTWKSRNCFEERVLLMIFRQIRAPESTSKRPFLRQEPLAEVRP